MIKTYFTQHFSTEKEKFYLTRSSIFHRNFLSFAKWLSGYSVTEFLYLNWSTELCIFLFELNMPFLIDLKIYIFGCHFKVVLLM